MLSDESKKKYTEKIKKIAEELAEEVMRNEKDIEIRFRSLDSDIHDILMDIGNGAMNIIGKSKEAIVKKKLRKKG